jgi:hypothetical protein
MLKVNITLMRIKKSPDTCKEESQIMTGEQNHRRVELQQQTIKLAA